MRATRASVALFLLTIAGAVSAQPFGPSGPEFRVNTTTSSQQWDPAAAMEPSGAFLIVWGQQRSEVAVYGQRFARTGARLGGEFRVNTFTTRGYSYRPSVSAGPDGFFVVAWAKSFSGEPAWIMARRFSSGSAIGGEFRVDTATGRYDRRISIANDDAGSFVVVWTRTEGLSGPAEIYGQRFTAAGAMLAGEFRVNATTSAKGAWNVSVARTSAGPFVVSWNPRNYGTTNGAFGRRFDAGGAPLGGQFIASDLTVAGGSSDSSVAVDGAGRIVLVWGGGHVYVRRFEATGAPIGAIFRADTGPVGYGPHSTKVVADSAGGFVVVWRYGNSSTGYAINARRYGSNGLPLGDEFRVNTSSDGEPDLQAVAGNGAGNFLVTWMRGPSDDFDVHAQLFCASLAGDANGDGSLSVSDVLYLINALFAGGPAPVRASDVNADGQLNVVDILFLINHLFAGGPSPACA